MKYLLKFFKKTIDPNKLPQLGDLVFYRVSFMEFDEIIGVITDKELYILDNYYSQEYILKNIQILTRDGERVSF